MKHIDPSVTPSTWTTPTRPRTVRIRNAMAEKRYTQPHALVDSDGYDTLMAAKDPKAGGNYPLGARVMYCLNNLIVAS